MSPPSSVTLKSDTHATESLNAKVMVDVDGVEEEAMALMAHSVLSSKVMSMLFRGRLQLSDAVSNSYLGIEGHWSFLPQLIILSPSFGAIH